MKTKLNNRLSQPEDRLNEFQNGLEEEIRKSRNLFGSSGIVSSDGEDVDNDLAAGALSVNATNSTAIDIGACTVVFPNGEFVDVGSTDITGYALDSSTADAQVVRLEYGEVEVGTEASPVYDVAFAPKTVKKTALEMLVVENITTYNALSSAVLNGSVVLGVARFEDGVLTLDNGRDTYTWNRPWFSPADVEHRSKVGSGTPSDSNPHGITLNDESVGTYTAWQALAGQMPCVLARPNGMGKIPGELCTEILPAGSFLSDSSGEITGVAGAFYAPLGKWPDRLLRAHLYSTPTTQVAAWIPKGRKIVAVSDPANFAAAQQLEIYYNAITAGAMPGSMAGLQTVTISPPGTEELMIAGGNLITELSDDKVLFTDVGLVPMAFDILCDGTGRVYKSPDVVYCNTLLDTLGVSAQPFTLQPTAPSRLRVAISNFVVGYTEVRLQISGTDESGATVSENVIFTGPGATPQPSFSEVTSQRLFTATIFSSLTQIQVLVRNGDGPNTTVTVFAEQNPERPDTQGDLLLGTVHWTGNQVTDLYANDSMVAFDRRIISKGGGAKGLSPVHSTVNMAMVADSYLGYLPAGTTKWCTIAEDFNDPQYMEYPNDYVGVGTSERPVELNSNSFGARNRYISRLITLGNTFTTSADALWLRLIPRDMRHPARAVSTFAFDVTLYDTSGTAHTLNGIQPTNPYPPYPIQLVGSPTGTWHAVQFSFHLPGSFPMDPAELFQGFIFHIRE